MRSYSTTHIDVLIEDDSEGNKWHFTSFYGNPVEGQRVHSWDLLRQLASDVDIPWVVMGDYNETLFSHKNEEVEYELKEQWKVFRMILRKRSWWI